MKKSRIAPIVLLPLTALALSGCTFEFSAGTSSSTPTTAESSDTTSSAPVESTEPSTEPSDDVTAEPSEAVSEPMESASAPEEAGKADPDEIATQAEEALEAQVGKRPDIDCGTEPAEVVPGGTHVCALTDAGSTEPVHDVTMTFTEVDGDAFKFDIQVAETPRP